eukprot:XP_011433214.1 PREDICTED: sperm motility kinase Tcr mutant form-like [Crassostrea gigas]
MDDHAYAIQHKIDDGAFGEVLCVKDTKTNQILAMKQILYRGDISKDPYIMNEIYSLSHLHHENVIKLMDVIITDKSVNLIMELAENGNLETFIQNNPLAFDQLSHIFFQLLSAVDFCHRNNIAHRDITPCNILLANKTSVRLADFGLSVPCRDSEGHVILCDDYLGHIHYSAPEVLKKTPYDPLLSDMWSVGVVLYFMIHANVPFTGDEEEIISQQTDDNIIKDLINRENEKGERYVGQYMTVMRNVLRGDPDIRCRTSNLLIMMNNET